MKPEFFFVHIDKGKNKIRIIKLHILKSINSILVVDKNMWKLKVELDMSMVKVEDAKSKCIFLILKHLLEKPNTAHKKGII